MISQAPSKFKHTTLSVFPGTFVGNGHYTPVVVGITLLDEDDNFTGVYLRDSNGGLWPARTVDKSLPEHHDSVCDSWMAREGINIDKRKVTR